MVKLNNAYIKGIQIKAVTVDLGQSSHTFKNPARVYINKDGSVTIQAVANEPAIARFPFVNDLTYTH